jgi:hypothetical protein
VDHSEGIVLSLFLHFKFVGIKSLETWSNYIM